jgi:hypothetical protein
MSADRPRDELGRPLPYGSIGFDAAIAAPPTGSSEILSLAQRLLDEGHPFHAHEILEDAWKAAPEGERDLWRGLAQLAVGLTHHARGNRAGAVALLARGCGAIEPYRGRAPYDIDVAGLIDWASGPLTQPPRLCLRAG